MKNGQIIIFIVSYNNIFPVRQNLTKVDTIAIEIKKLEKLKKPQLLFQLQY